MPEAFPLHLIMRLPLRVTALTQRRVGAGSAGTAVLLQLSTPSVAQAAHHQHHRALLNVQSVDRIIYSIFQRFKPGMEKPHPQGFYTSSLTSPALEAIFPFVGVVVK